MGEPLYEFQPRNKVVKWIDYRLPIFTVMHRELVAYPTPWNLNYLWNFGVLAGIALVVLIVTGLVLAMQYTAHVDHAFASIDRIMREVQYGWLLRYIHMNMASFFFIFVYIHIFRGLFYGSYKNPREILWILGVIILLLMMATAFLGYTLPWGQMSYWAATVITKLFSAFPLIGDAIVTWLWGGFSVDNPTLNRFFVLHFVLPFAIVAVVFLHIWALHRFGSNNPVGIDASGPQDKIPFHPYYTVKDLFTLGLVLIAFALVTFFAPNYLGHAINYAPADPLQTPAHIVPEWYFLPFYAILRAVPDKLIGVILMFGSVLILLVVPWLDRSPVRSGAYRPVFKWFYALLVVDVLVLGYGGSQPPEQPWILINQIATLYYFAYFLVILPLLGYFERPKPLPSSISKPVLGGGAQPAGAAAKPMEKA
jgi:ubiquinol-cytochrome c reductase cytochrome b subunit